MQKICFIGVNPSVDLTYLRTPIHMVSSVLVDHILAVESSDPVTLDQCYKTFFLHNFLVGQVS
jgi:hypothetical protein